jgi:endonuclease/exonuclease/phosphatase family metal-dependent hydrolase
MPQYAMRKRLVTVLLIFFALPAGLFAQTSSGTGNFIRIGFYNAENYFDPFVDSASSYHEFDPGGDRHWDRQKYIVKRQHIFKVLAAMGGWHGMDVMAFAEIENRFVLEDLLKNTPLGTKNYGIIHFESPDHRGIDVGLIYRKSTFRPLYARAVPVRDLQDTTLKTRDILYVKGMAGGDTLHLFINHWPSRYGGLMATVSKRVLAAKILMCSVDSVCRQNPDAKILILGDFNETLSDKGIQDILHEGVGCGIAAMPARFDHGLARGTIRGKSGWAVFDRIFCSKNLLFPAGIMFVRDKSFHIFDVPFLLESDKNKTGLKPDRTYNGFTWHGGFSDHLPVYVDVQIEKTH